MTGGQKYVLFWSLRPSLSSRVGQKKESSAPTESLESVPASNENVTPSLSIEKVMEETYTCGVAVGLKKTPLVALTGTASGSFVVWENFECVRVIPSAHGKRCVFCKH